MFEHMPLWIIASSMMKVIIGGTLNDAAIQRSTHWRFHSYYMITSCTPQLQV